MLKIVTAPSEAEIIFRVELFLKEGSWRLVNIYQRNRGAEFVAWLVKEKK